MSSMRSFTAAKSAAKGDAIPIRIGDAKDPAAEVFHIGQPLPTLSLLEVADAGAHLEELDQPGADPAMKARVVSAFVGFLREAIGEDDWPRFWGACKRHRIGEQGLVQIVEHLVTEVTGRPTGAPASSPRSRSAGGRASRARSSGRATASRSKS